MYYNEGACACPSLSIVIAFAVDLIFGDATATAIARSEKDSNISIYCLSLHELLADKELLPGPAKLLE